VGVDVCAIARIEKAMARQPEKLLARLLTPAERKARKAWTAAQVARRWALKEAVAKALGTGIGGRYGFQEIEVTYDSRKAPKVAVKGYAGEIMASVADDAGVAVAVAFAG
jgi:holo-[acyl-carrier protein] synthase